MVSCLLALDTCQVPSAPPLNSTDFGFFAKLQYIIPTINFSGCGEITDWTIVGAGRGGGGTRERTIELQLFRPDPTRSTVFTEVNSAVLTTNVNQGWNTHTFTPIGFTFSPGDVLGFYYPNTVDFLVVRRTSSFSTHSVLTSTITPGGNVVTATALTGAFSLYVPLMFVSSELSYLMLVQSVLYSHHCVCGYLLCVVICTECPRSTTILPSTTATVPSSTATVLQSTMIVSTPSSQPHIISGTSPSETTLSPGTVVQCVIQPQHPVYTVHLYQVFIQYLQLYSHRSTRYYNCTRCF